MVYMCWSPRGPCNGVVWTVAISWSRRSSGVARLLCSDTLSVRLCQLGPASTKCTFWRLLGGEGSRLEGLTRRPISPQAPEASRGVCFLVSHLCMTLLEEWLTLSPLGGLSLGNQPRIRLVCPPYLLILNIHNFLRPTLEAQHNQLSKKLITSCRWMMLLLDPT
jgi:hypothetical protein